MLPYVGNKTMIKDFRNEEFTGHGCQSWLHKSVTENFHVAASLLLSRLGIILDWGELEENEEQKQALVLWFYLRPQPLFKCFEWHKYIN